VKRLLAFLLLWIATAYPSAFGQEFDETFEHWPVELKVNGNIIVSGGLQDSSILKETLRRIGRATKVALLLDADASEAIAKEYRALFDQAVEAVVVTKADGNLPEQLRGLVENCDVLCWHSSKTVSDEVRAELTKSRSILNRHITKGGSIIVVGPVAELLASLNIATEEAHPSVAPGLGLFPDCVIEVNYDNSAHHRGRLLSVLASHPRTVGIGVARNTALVLSGRKLRVLGDGKATLLLMANERQPLRIKSITAPSSRRLNPSNLADLTQWRREAIDRTLAPFPAAEPKTPFVENGTLVIVGGGGMPEGLMSQFVELAGGLEKAKLVPQILIVSV